jgi:hypothetical protein
MLSKQVLYCLRHTSSSFCSGYFGDRVSNFLPRLASNQDPPNLSLQRITSVSHQCVVGNAF